MLENGMIINQEQYDPQCQPMPYTCCFCNEGVNEVTTYRNGDTVCEDCNYEYLLAEGSNFVDDFISDNDKYYTDWFDWLSDHMKLRCIKEIYKKQEKFEKSVNILYYENNLKSHRKCWCADTDEFISYVESRCLDRQIAK